MDFMVVGDARLEQVEVESQKLELSSFLDVSSLPPYYVDYFQNLEAVPRYVVDGYPVGCIEDNGKDHTLRSMEIVKNLGISPAVQQIAIRTLFIHDLAEVEVGDFSVVEGVYPDGHDERELQVAANLFTPTDLELFNMFKRADLFLRAPLGTDYQASSFKGRVVFLSKLVDSIDGNLHFHSCLSKWVRSGNTDLPPSNSLEWMFGQFSVYKDRLGKLKVPPKDIEGFTNLLVDQLITVQQMWSGLEIPEVIAKGFKSVEEVTTARLLSQNKKVEGLNS